MLDLQLKKLKLDQDAEKTAAKAGELSNLPTAQGQVLTRNDLLERLIKSGKQTDN